MRSGSGCAVMRDTRNFSASSPPSPPPPSAPFYNTLNNNNKQQRSATLDTTVSTGCDSIVIESSPRLRVRSSAAVNRAKLMPLRKHPASASRSSDKLDQILTNCNTRAMRYYRIWIYTCNAVLLVSILGFCAVASKTVLGDYRRHLIPSLALYQPSFLYAYLAIFTQSGVIQLVGCMGALRLSERLLNVYWLMLLVLLFGDVVIGIFWMFRLDRILQELRPGLKFRLNTEYGNQDSDLTGLWDRLQYETGCCGVDSASDFGRIAATRSVSHMLQYQWSPDGTNFSKRILVPASCCAHIDTTNNGDNTTTTTRCQAVHPTGCEDRLRVYLRQTSETLFLIGYCVIAFVKVCFIGILRYEIREMIQKIKLLKAEMESRPSVASIDLTSSPRLGGAGLSPSHTVLIGTGGASNANGSVRGAGADGGTESERESLLVRDIGIQEQDTPAHCKRSSLSADDLEYRQRSLMHRKLFPGDSAGQDSESHCALLVDDSTPVTKTPPNGNNNYEMREFQLQTQPSAQSQYGGRLMYRMSNPDTQTHNM